MPSLANTFFFFFGFSFVSHFVFLLVCICLYFFLWFVSYFGMEGLSIGLYFFFGLFSTSVVVLVCFAFFGFRFVSTLVWKGVSSVLFLKDDVFWYLFFYLVIGSCFGSFLSSVFDLCLSNLIAGKGHSLTRYTSLICSLVWFVFFFAMGVFLREANRKRNRASPGQIATSSEDERLSFALTRGERGR